MPIHAELHSHNSFSNFHVGDKEPPYDCMIDMREQLDCAHNLGLDTIFVTNHNTLEGYSQLLKYKNDHAKFKNITVFPAEEISTDSGAHVLAYGIYDEIPAGLPLDQVLDEIKRQGGVSSAAHPFGLINALRDDAVKCDMIEVFNSNNVDTFSNMRAAEFALEHNKIQTAGSDSHVLSTIGRCINVIDSENDLDQIMYAMQHGKIKISQTGYMLQNEALEHLQYKINNSRQYIEDYISEHHHDTKWLFSLLLKIYDHNQNSFVLPLFYKVALYMVKRISHKINFQDQDPNVMNERNISAIFRASL